MKLYYSAGSCSTSCHISLEESGLKYEAIAIDWENEKDPNVQLVAKLNPLGTLPVFITDEGVQLDQNSAIHAYIADKVPEKKLLPPVGSIERAQALNWLSFVCSDLHKSFSPLFSVKGISSDQAIQDVIRKWSVENVNQNLAYLDEKLSGKDYLMGKDFTVADAYCFIVIGWTQWVDISLDKYKNIQAYQQRVAERPAVKKVYEVEGLNE